ncbi:MAG: DNA cytosine methyltransferase [Deltaproteobacteria bacterium]|nr:DNA cytosine methyltransferase [Deltaproteobacteria bacterium]
MTLQNGPAPEPPGPASTSGVPLAGHWASSLAAGPQVCGTPAEHRPAAGKRAAPRLISLFSGCGGLDLGFEKAGFRRVWANDHDPDAQRVYELNLGPIDPRNILDVDASEIPDGEMLAAGFPCQPFSNAGNRGGVRDSRGMLYKECLRIIASKAPSAVLFENVKGLLSTRDQEGRLVADTIEDDLDALGYRVSRELVNAADYGVPQNRQRVFFVGVRKELGRRFDFPPGTEGGGRTLKTVLRMPRGVPNQAVMPLSPLQSHMVGFIPEGGSWKDVPDDALPRRFLKIRGDMKRYHSPNFYRRFSRNEICGTITASAQPENCGIIHPTEDRRFSIREIARIQTFPDGFLFLDGTGRDVAAMYKVIGNAVPVKLARALASALMDQVFGRARPGGPRTRSGGGTAGASGLRSRAPKPVR